MSERLTLVGFVIAATMFLAGCNFKDELDGPPTSGCEDNRDCDDHGTCDVERGVGVCACDPGYEGSTCRDCSAGFEEDGSGDCVAVMNNVTNNNSNNTTPTNNNSTGMCEEGEVLVGEMCFADGCAANPCGDGQCTVTGDGTWECECPNGTSGIECPSCDAGCLNGSCNGGDVCVCDRGWAGAECNTCASGFQGAACDTCAPNAFGPDCATCASLNAAEPWWDDGYRARAGVLVFNPMSENRAVLDGVAVQHTFTHSQLVNMGADAIGRDIRIVASPDTEVDRILGFNSQWNQPDTTIWFPTQSTLQPGDFEVFYLYSGNPAPEVALNDAGEVLRQDRGWWYGGGVPGYSAASRSFGQYSVQIRQRNVNDIEVYFHDAGNDITAAAQINFVDTTTGATVASRTYGASQGSSAVPADVFETVSGLPNSMRLDVLINAGDGGAETSGIYLGAALVQSGVATLSYQATLSRANNQSAPPMVFTCSPEMAP